MNHVGNQPPESNDYKGMDHTEARELISLDVDGLLEDATALDAHLGQCPECRAFHDRAVALATRTRPPTWRRPDLEPRHFWMYRWLRFALAWTGVILIAWSTPGVFDTTTDVTYIHVARHQAAFGVALGIVFLVVAWRPDRAYGLVPVAATFTIALSGAAIVDLIDGASSLSKESRHLVELVGLGMLWALGANAGPGTGLLGRSKAEMSTGD